MALTQRETEILQFEIDRLNQLIANFIFYNISSKKINKATALRDHYQAKLDE